LHQLTILSKETPIMAWPEIEMSCGHTEQHQLYGPHKDRDRKAAGIAQGVCKECEAAARAEASRQAAHASRKEGLPDLIGTERQIQWAETLRRTAIDAHWEIMDQIVKAGGKDPRKTQRAAWWIDHRQDTRADWVARLLCCPSWTWEAALAAHPAEAKALVGHALASRRADEQIAELTALSTALPPRDETPQQATVRRWAPEIVDWLNQQLATVAAQAATRAAEATQQAQASATAAIAAAEAARTAGTTASSAAANAQIAAGAAERAATAETDAAVQEALLNGSALAAAQEALRVALGAVPPLKGTRDTPDRTAERNLQAERVLAQEARLRGCPYGAAKIILATLASGVTWTTDHARSCYNLPVPVVGSDVVDLTPAALAWAAGGQKGDRPIPIPSWSQQKPPTGP
jgi:hypothetical protein